MPCHASGHLAIYHESYKFERAFLTFVFYHFFRSGFPGAGSSTSKLVEFHADLGNIASAQLFVCISVIHKRGMVVGSIYGLQLTGCVMKNLPPSGFELFQRQVSMSCFILQKQRHAVSKKLKP